MTKEKILHKIEVKAAEYGLMLPFIAHEMVRFGTAMEKLYAERDSKLDNFKGVSAMYGVIYITQFC